MNTDAAAAGQVTRTAAEIYDEFFVPALFGQFAKPLCDMAEIGSDSRVLDVACGTGATTREAAARVTSPGRIVGLDRNEGMLSVAAKRDRDIQWNEGHAEALPFADNSFDVVLCQFGLMFFDDRTKALAEMRRVLGPGGRIAVTTWDDVDHSPGYAAMIELIDEMFGKEAADALRAPFVLGDRQALDEVLQTGGLGDARISTVAGTARFESIREWVRMDVRGWTLADLIDDAGFETLVAAAEERMAGFAASDGTVAFPAPVHIAVWTRG